MVLSHLSYVRERRGTHSQPVNVLSANDTGDGKRVCIRKGHLFCLFHPNLFICYLQQSLHVAGMCYGEDDARICMRSFIVTNVDLFFVVLYVVSLFVASRLTLY